MEIKGRVNVYINAFENKEGDIYLSISTLLKGFVGEGKKDKAPTTFLKVALSNQCKEDLEIEEDYFEDGQSEKYMLNVKSGWLSCYKDKSGNIIPMMFINDADIEEEKEEKPVKKSKKGARK